MTLNCTHILGLNKKIINLEQGSMSSGGLQTVVFNGQATGSRPCNLLTWDNRST